MSETNYEKPKLFHLPEAGKLQLPEFKPCTMEELPPKVHEYIYHQKRLDEVMKSTELRSPMVMDFGKNGQAYIMAYHQQSTIEGYLGRYYAIYEVDTTPNGEVMGSGSTLLELDDSNRLKGEPPFVQLTLTKEEFRQQGLAIRRLLILNEANKLLFHNKLASGSFASSDPGAEGAWQSLASFGYAVQDEYGGYRFIK